MVTHDPRVLSAGDRILHLEDGRLVREEATGEPARTPELARAAIASVSVLGALHASPAVKAALADRTR